MKKLSIIILAIIQTLIFASCKSVTTDSDKLQVYTSFYAMYDFAKQIGFYTIKMLNNMDVL